MMKADFRQILTNIEAIINDNRPASVSELKEIWNNLSDMITENEDYAEQKEAYDEAIKFAEWIWKSRKYIIQENPEVKKVYQKFKDDES